MYFITSNKASLFIPFLLFCRLLHHTIIWQAKSYPSQLAQCEYTAAVLDGVTCCGLSCVKATFCESVCFQLLTAGCTCESKIVSPFQSFLQTINHGRTQRGKMVVNEFTTVNNCFSRTAAFDDGYLFLKDEMIA